MRRRPEIVLLALLAAGCGVLPPVEQPAIELGATEQSAVEPADELSGYVELAAVVAEIPPERSGPVRQHFERAHDEDPASVEGRMKLAIVLLEDQAATDDRLERARGLLDGLEDDPSASPELRRFAGLLARLVDRRLTLARLLVERVAEVDRARTSLARIERSRDHTRLEIEALRRALASSETKLREIVRIERAVESSGATEVVR